MLRNENLRLKNENNNLIERTNNLSYILADLGAVHMSRASPVNRADSILSRPVMA